MSTRSYRVQRKRDAHSEGVVVSTRKARELIRSLGNPAEYVSLRLTPRRRTSKDRRKGSVERA